MKKPKLLGLHVQKPQKGRRGVWPTDSMENSWAKDNSTLRKNGDMEIRELNSNMLEV